MGKVIEALRQKGLRSQIEKEVSEAIIKSMNSYANDRSIANVEEEDILITVVKDSSSLKDTGREQNEIIVDRKCLF
jgi:hypothetical protein